MSGDAAARFIASIEPRAIRTAPLGRLCSGQSLYILRPLDCLREVPCSTTTMQRKFPPNGTRGSPTSARTLPQRTVSCRTSPLHGRRYVLPAAPALRQAELTVRSISPGLRTSRVLGERSRRTTPRSPSTRRGSPRPLPVGSLPRDCSRDCVQCNTIFPSISTAYHTSYPRPSSSTSATYSAIAKLDVNPGLSIPRRLNILPSNGPASGDG